MSVRIALKTLCWAGVGALSFVVPSSVVAADATIVLSAPGVVKLDWNTRALSSVDLDGDKLNDLVVINNDRAAIELLYQIKPGAPVPAPARRVATNRWEPELEDARFRKVRITTGVTMMDLVVADFNGDGRPDLAYSGDPQALTVRYQQPDGSWLEKKITDAPVPLAFVGSLRAADVDGDGRQDLVMLGLKELAIFYQDRSGEFLAPERMALIDDGSYGLEVVDVDGDGRLDIVYLNASNRDGLRVRLQAAARQFGPEQSFPLKPARSTLQVLAKASSKTPLRFAYAQDQTGHIAQFTLEKRKGQGTTPLSDLRPRVFSPRINAKLAASYVLGDFDGDGLEDIAVGDPDGAQGILYRRQKDGSFGAAERFPSLADVRALASGDWDGDGRADLFVASPKEQTVGVASLGKDGRFSYPQPLPTTGKPLALAAGPLAGGPELWLAVLRDEKSKKTIDLWTRRNGVAELVQSIEVSGTRTDPKALRMVDINQDGRLDLLVFTALEPMRAWIQGPPSETGQLKFTDASSGAAFRKGLVDNLDASALTLGDIDGDGKNELLVARQGFARALKLSDDKELVVVDQYNARDSSADVLASFVLPGEKGTLPWVVLYDKKGERLEVLRADDKKVYQVVESIPVGKIDLVGTDLRYDEKSGRRELFLWGRDRFWWLPVGTESLYLTEGTSYATDLPEISYSDVIAGDLNGDHQIDLACIDPVHNVLEFLSRDESGTWQSRLHFQVFETDAHAQQRKGGTLEPRETIIADVTGDGVNDLVLLIHDRILVYPSKR